MGRISRERRRKAELIAEAFGITKAEIEALWGLSDEWSFWETELDKMADEEAKIEITKEVIKEKASKILSKHTDTKKEEDMIFYFFDADFEVKEKYGSGRNLMG